MRRISPLCQIRALVSVCVILLSFSGCTVRLSSHSSRISTNVDEARLNYGVDITITPQEGVTRGRHIIIIAPDKEGMVYTLSGYFNGQIVSKTKNTQLKLNGLYLERDNGKTALLCKAKTEISTAAGTNNYILSAGRSYIKDGALHSTRDLVLGGSGTLYVKGAVWHGIEGDDVKIKGSGAFFIEGSKRGSALTCDSLTVEPEKTFSAYFTNAKNGIKADKSIKIASGTFYLYDNYTAIKANALTCTGGTICTFGNNQLFVTKKDACNLTGATLIEEQ